MPTGTRSAIKALFFVTGMLIWASVGVGQNRFGDADNNKLLEMADAQRTLARLLDLIPASQLSPLALADGDASLGLDDLLLAAQAVSGARTGVGPAPNPLAVTPPSPTVVAGGTFPNPVLEFSIASNFPDAQWVDGIDALGFSILEGGSVESLLANPSAAIAANAASVELVPMNSGVGDDTVTAQLVIEIADSDGVVAETISASSAMTVTPSSCTPLACLTGGVEQIVGREDSWSDGFDPGGWMSIGSGLYNGGSVRRAVNSSMIYTGYFTTQSVLDEFYVWILSRRVTTLPQDHSKTIRVDGNWVGVYDGLWSGGIDGFQWQMVGSVTLASGLHDLTVQGVADFTQYFDGYALTTDPVLNPESDFLPHTAFNLDDPALDLYQAGTPAAECCGDCVLQAGEECDWGDGFVAYDGCAGDCQMLHCGDGVVQIAETCDDGNNVDCDGCTADCSRVDNVCGDWIIECAETCDDGDVDHCTTACDATCSGPYTVVCGDAVVECDEPCDDGPGEGPGLCADDCSGVQTCGDDLVNGTELCEPNLQTCCNPTCDGILGFGASCRAAAGVCDVEEVCDGISPLCPTDAYQSDGSPCPGDGNYCNGVEECQGGQCVGAGFPCVWPTEMCVEASDACDPNLCGNGSMDAGEVCEAGADVGTRYECNLFCSETCGMEHEWAHNYGDPNYYAQFSNAVAVDSAGNSYMAGMFSFEMNLGVITLVSSAPERSFLAKFDTDGLPLWANSFGVGGTNSKAVEVEVDSSDNVYLLGDYQKSIPAEPFDLGCGPIACWDGADNGRFYAKFDPSGSCLWSRCIQGSAGIGDRQDLHALLPNGDSAVYTIILNDYDFGAGLVSVGGTQEDVLVKYDANGNTIGASIMNRPLHTFDDTIYAVDLGPNGETYVAGGWVISSYSECFIERYDSSGLLTQSSSYIANPAGWPQTACGIQRIAVDGVGNVWAAGLVEGDDIDFGGGPIALAQERRFFLIQYDSNLNYLDSTVFPEPDGGTLNWLWSLELTLDGQPALMGFYDMAQDFGGDVLPWLGPWDITYFIAQFDQNGSHRWSRGYLFDIGSFDIPNWTVQDMAISASGNFILSGRIPFPIGLDFGAGPVSADPTDFEDVYIAKLAPEGYPNCWTCGDGSLDPGEVCDDGNHLPGDGCSGDCRSDESCGNGYWDKYAGEACDDGNLTGGDYCNPTCTGP